MKPSEALALVAEVAEKGNLRLIAGWWKINSYDARVNIDSDPGGVQPRGQGSGWRQLIPDPVWQPDQVRQRVQAEVRRVLLFAARV